MLIDTHSHLYWESYREDLEQIIQRSIDAGVTTIINVGVDVELSKKALEQVKNTLTNIPNLLSYSTIGIHPHEAAKYSSTVSIHEDIIELEKIYQSDTTKVVAVGECGLDFLFNNPETATLSINKQKDLQRRLFQAQIDLAQKLKLPLIVHCRDDRSKNLTDCEAWDEVLELTKNHFGIYHCYSGLLNTTYKILNTNFLVSFAATITYPKNDYLREAAKILPLERIVLETDCPFLPPQSKRGQRNEPANILETAQLIAQLKGITLKDLATQTTNNVKALFNLD